MAPLIFPPKILPRKPTPNGKRDGRIATDLTTLGSGALSSPGSNFLLICTDDAEIPKNPGPSPLKVTCSPWLAASADSLFSTAS